MLGRACDRLLCVTLTMLTAACATCPDGDRQAPGPVWAVEPTERPVQIDGRLDEPVWSRCRVHPLDLAGQDNPVGDSARETGTVRFARDDEWLYVGVSFEDSDVVAEGEQGQQHHYQFGDVAELFIKPADRTWYWEMYVTPSGMKTAFFIPGRGRLPLPSNFSYTSGLLVAAQVDGTLNDWRDRDTGWTAEMAFPLDELKVDGEEVCLDELTVLMARYNYSRYLGARELSTWPPLTVENFHRYEEYAPLTARDTTSR